MRLDLFRQLRKKTGKMAFNTRFYNWTLGGTVPEHFVVTPQDSWPGDPEQGRWLCNGVFAIDQNIIETPGNCWELEEGLSQDWLAHMHGFSWLRDLRAMGGDPARQQARGMIRSWIRKYRKWDPDVWRSDLTGQRIANWIALYDFFGSSADDLFQYAFFDSLGRQGRHLARTLPGADLHGLPLLHAFKGLIYAGLSFQSHENWLEQGLDGLQIQIKKQIRNDGGHISRSPAQLVEALQIIIDIRGALLAGNYPVPDGLQQGIDRMAQALRFFRYPDKKLAVFNGAQENDTGLMDTVLAKANARGKILKSLPDSGYRRMTLGRSLLMIDTGNAPLFPDDASVHCAPLAFEFIYGKQRVFVNCGTHPLDDNWRDSLRGTAAHNSLSIDYRNVCEIGKDGHIGRKPHHVDITCEEQNGALLAEMMHDGYAALNGITHRRRIFLGDNGHDLRGEENLTCSVGLNRTASIALRFHLHPRVLVSLIRDGTEALLRLPGGAGWRFFHQGGVMTLENSVYLGEGTRPRKTKQLVIYGEMNDDFARIKWALRREGR